MRLNCPNCGEAMPAENINIQEMVAVCPACDTVFPFEAPEQKTKRRKVKQPDGLTLHDGAVLEMEFRTNWRLDRSEEFVGTAAFSGSFSFVALIMLAAALQGEMPLVFPLLFGMVAAVADYSLATLLWNKTHITMDDQQITIRRKPLPSLLSQVKHVSLAGVVAIRTEETETSRKEAYDTPRFRVWAETADGIRRTIANDLVEEYAFFVAQRLQERLEMLGEVDISRLDADAAHEGNETLLDAPLTAVQATETEEE